MSKGYKLSGGPKQVKPPSGGAPMKPHPQKPSTSSGGAPIAPGKPHPEKPSSQTRKQGIAALKNRARQGKQNAKNQARKHAQKDTSSTDYLAPLSPAALKKQATQTIGSAYKPSFGDLNSQQKRLTAIQNKRMQDNKYYEHWMSSKMTALNAQASAQDTAFNTQMQQANALTSGLFGGQQQDLVQQANARQGNVSDNAQSTAFGTDLTNNQNLSNAATGVAEQAAVGNVQSGSDLLKSNELNNVSRINDNAEKQQSDYQQSLSDLAAQRSKLQLSKAGDIEKEIARLQGIEIQKAQNQQQVTLAEQTLGANVAKDKADAANTAASIKAGNFKAALQFKEFNATLAANRWKTKYEQASELQRSEIAARTSLSEHEVEAALENKKFVEDVKKDGWEHAATIWKQNHPNAGSPPKNSPETFNEQQGKFDQIDQTRGIINGLIAANNDPGRDTAVYQALANGTPIQVGWKTLASGKREPVMKTYQPVPTVILNAAFDLSSKRTGLTPKDIAKLRSIGLRHIKSHGYRLAS